MLVVTPETSKNRLRIGKPSTGIWYTYNDKRNDVIATNTTCKAVDKPQNNPNPLIIKDDAELTDRNFVFTIFRIKILHDNHNNLKI